MSTTATNRSEAARKAAETRRQREAAELREFRRTHYRVDDEDLDSTFYGPEFRDSQRTLDEVIAHVSERYRWVPGVDVDEDWRPVQDFAIWRDGRLRAVIRRGPDGEPVVTKFGDDD
jgi:hypothetical protein